MPRWVLNSIPFPVIREPVDRLHERHTQQVHRKVDRPATALLARVVPEARRRQDLEISPFRQNVPSTTPEVLARHVRRIGLQVGRDLPQDVLARQLAKSREHVLIEASAHPGTVLQRLTGGEGET